MVLNYKRNKIGETRCVSKVFDKNERTSNAKGVDIQLILLQRVLTIFLITDISYTLSCYGPTHTRIGE